MRPQAEAGKETHLADVSDPVFITYPNRETRLGDLPISRALPVRERRMVGPWCFLDRYGPLSFTDKKAMHVAPHPHIGLQTVSWLLEGEVLHTDSLGFEAVVRPGGVNVMTSGNGISHAEESPMENSGKLNGVQLWVALPETQRSTAPSFTHVDRVPLIETPQGVVQVFAGSLGATPSPATYFSPIVGLDLQVHAGRKLELEANPGFEHALLVLEGNSSFENQPLQPYILYFLGAGRTSLAFKSQSGGRLLLLGGAPFGETILMWWNFVARTPEEIALARADWEAARRGVEGRFGKVLGDHGAWLAAPDLLRFARPNPAS